MPSDHQQNNDLNAENVKKIAEDMIRQSEEKESLEAPEPLMPEIDSQADASNEDFFKDRTVETMNQFRLDMVEAMYMSDT